MTGRGEAARGPARPPLQQRSRRRWAIACGIAASWIFLVVVTGSAISATVLLVIIAGLAAVSAGGLRALGVTRDHPWIRQLASRPWRDGQDVLKVAMRHLPDVFVITPGGSLLAPNVVELQLNSDDLLSLCERMELSVISASLTEAYEEQVATFGARLAGPGRAHVYVTAGSVPPGRYRWRQGDPVSAGAQPDMPDAPYPPDVRYAVGEPEFAYAVPPPHAYPELHSQVWHGHDPDLTVRSGMVTMIERNLPAVPALRLVTGSSVAQTRMSGARAGRGSVELVLPDVSTVSREHARFTFSDGRWWIANQGRNGLSLNGGPVTGEQPISDGDEIRWGTRPDSLLSRVEIT